jgi:hypothetical protein
MTDSSSANRDGESHVAFFDFPDLGLEAVGHVPAELLAPPIIAAAPVDRPADRSSTPAKTRDYFVPRDLTKRWGVCVDKVLRFIQTGELRAFNVASQESRRPRYRISMEEVRRFEEQTRAAAPPAAMKKEPHRRRKSPTTTPSARTYF